MSDAEYRKWQESTEYLPHAFSRVVRDAWEHQQTRIKELERKRDAAYLELYKIQPVIKAVFERDVWEKVKRAAAPEVGE